MMLEGARIVLRCFLELCMMLQVWILFQQEDTEQVDFQMLSSIEKNIWRCNLQANNGAKATVAKRKNISG